MNINLGSLNIIFIKIINSSSSDRESLLYSRAIRNAFKSIKNIRIINKNIKIISKNIKVINVFRYY